MTILHILSRQNNPMHSSIYHMISFLGYPRFPCNKISSCELLSWSGIVTWSSYISCHFPLLGTMEDLLHLPIQSFLPPILALGPLSCYLPFFPLSYRSSNPATSIFVFYLHSSPSSSSNHTPAFKFQLQFLTLLYNSFSPSHLPCLIPIFPVFLLSRPRGYIISHFDFII